MVNCNDILLTAEFAAVEAGKLFLSGRPAQIITKSPSDYVTDVDINCQNLIKDTIRSKYPGHKFLAEEDGCNFEAKDDLWIIDPIDGTTNFIHGLKHSAVSIAFYSENEVKAGVIHNPYTNETFTAIKGKGAFLNGRKISVSYESEMKKGLIATGMPFRKHEKIPKYFQCLGEVLRNSSGIRRMGCASLDIAYTACGRFEGFFEGWLSPWDIAAGILIIEEAGGTVSDFQGKKDYFQHGCIIAASQKIYPRFFEIINNALKDEQ
jgi:myo-inositol-1(or 4)-monophosphatase